VPSTIFTAPEYDPQRERRKRIIVAAVISAVVLIAIFAYLYRNWPEERIVDHFFNALQNKNYEQAYGIWMHDPDWKAHPQQYANYPFSDFYRDWGPGGEWGLIKNYHVDGSVTPRGGGSGVIVQVTVNGRAEKARLWVEKKSKTMTFCLAEGC
jgi:hypothetical protein